ERCKFPALEFPDPAFADLMDRNRIEIVQLLAAMPERGDEVGRFENPKVLCHRLPRHGEAVAEFVQRLSVFDVKPVEQRAPRRIGKRFEDFIHGSDNRQPKGCMSRACVGRSRALWYRRPQPAQIGLEQMGWKMSGRLKLAASFSILFLTCPAIASAQQQVIGAPPEARNMKLVGTNDLQARSGYQPTIHHQGDRWIAYIGHHGGSDDIPAPVNPQTGKGEPNGTSIVDVTDPSQPKYLRHVPGQEGKYESGGAQMVRICDGKALPKGDRNAVYMLRTFGGEAHEIWNVADPQNPVLITRIGGLKDTHKNWWECDTGIAFLVSGAPDWRTRRMTQVYDLSDPAHPVKIRDFGLPGQEPGSTGAVPTELHGMISTGPQGNRVYFGYGTNKGGIMQILDRDKLLNGPKEPTPDNLRLPEISRMPMSAMNGAHTTFPMPGMPIAEFARDKDGKNRDIVMIVDEAILNECNEPRQMVWFADVTVENRPMM